MNRIILKILLLLIVLFSLVKTCPTVTSLLCSQKPCGTTCGCYDDGSMRHCYPY